MQRPRNLLFGIVRLGLSLIMLAVLVIGGYSAFKHFSGLDPKGLDAKSLIVNSAWEIIGSVEANQILDSILSFKIPTSLPSAPVTSQEVTNPTPRPGAEIILRFALVADSHNANPNLTTALLDAKAKQAKFVIGLGDYTEVGTDSELKAVKDIFNSVGLPYYLTAGDHDLWNARDKGVSPEAKFNSIFGSPYQSFSDSGVRFLILYNADNYQGLDEVQMNWLETQVETQVTNPAKLTLAFLHEPLYHPSSDHFMGRVTPNLKSQAQKINQLLQKGGVKEVFYGDTHFFGRYKEPSTGLRMTTIGALTAERNAQRPRYSLVEVWNDYQYNVSDIELK